MKVDRDDAILGNAITAPAAPLAVGDPSSELDANAKEARSSAAVDEPTEYDSNVVSNINEAGRIIAAAEEGRIDNLARRGYNKKWIVNRGADRF